MGLTIKHEKFCHAYMEAGNVAMIHLFLATCYINNVEPYACLKDVLTRIPDPSIQQLEDLLPGYLPGVCR